MLPKVYPVFCGEVTALLAMVSEMEDMEGDAFAGVCALLVALVRAYPLEMAVDQTFRRLFGGLMEVIQVEEWALSVSKGWFFKIVREMQTHFPTFLTEWADVCLKVALRLFSPCWDMDLLLAIAEVFVDLVAEMPTESRALFLANAEEIYVQRPEIFQCSDALPKFVQTLATFEISQ
jgi:hypothetical protein